MRRSSPNLNRRTARYEPRRRFVLFCEGENTEPAYFRSLGTNYGRAIIDIHIVPNAGVPITIANSAVDFLANTRRLHRRRGQTDSFEQNDEVWAIFDRDDHPRHADAVAICEAKGVQVARSNPCFEVWLILHFCAYHRPDDRHQVQDFLRSLDSTYDPGGRKIPNCAVLIQQVILAEERATDQLARRLEEGDPNGRPSTTVFRLTQAIRKAAESAR